MKKILLSCALLLSAGATLAQTAPAADAPRPAPTPPARGPSLDLALEAARTAIDTCSARDQKIGVAVLDADGVVKVLLGADGASARGRQSGNAKAVTSLQFKAPTSQLAEQVKTDKELADKIAANPALNARAGAVPIKVGNEIIGAIGVGGARGSDIDEACAVAGLQKVQSRLQ